MIHHSLLLREHVHVLTVSLSVLSKALYTKLHVEWWWRITYSFSAQMRFSSMQHRCYEVSSFSSELKILSFFSCVVSSSQIFLEGDGGVDFCFSHHALNRPSSSQSTHVLMQATDTALLHSERKNGKKQSTELERDRMMNRIMYRCMVSYKWLSLMNIWWAKWWNQLTP